MRKTARLFGVLVVLTASAAHGSPPPTTLQAAFETAVAQGGYDRYLALETGRVYTGGLLIGPTWDEDRTLFIDDELGLDVMIEGNGAILDLQGQQICISFCGNRLDIQDCIVLDGGVRYRGDVALDIDRIPEGSVTYCTFFRPHDYAVRLEGAGAGVICERNIVVDAVDTGPDGLIWSGITGENLPTGLAFGLSVQIGSYGMPAVRDNWTWFRDGTTNAELLRHYCLLCEYG
ncbi:hypothetical protein KJ554_05415 [bacterium]|nr:hypothetical protein [bacterium]